MNLSCFSYHSERIEDQRQEIKEPRFSIEARVELADVEKKTPKKTSIALDAQNRVITVRRVSTLLTGVLIAKRLKNKVFCN